MTNLPEAYPQEQSSGKNLREVHCPFCDSTNVELFSLYGQTLLGSQYYCQNCKSIFEAIRYDDETAESPEGLNANDVSTTSNQNPSGLETNHDL